MTERHNQEGNLSRLRRVVRLRTAWRTQPTKSADAPADALPYDPLLDQRRTDALDSNDQIRAEAPDDLETRRRADQLEREIKRPSRGSSGNP